MKAFATALLLTVLVAPLANARIAICPISGRPYDTTTGRNVDIPGTSDYVAPSERDLYRPRGRSGSRRGTRGRGMSCMFPGSCRN